MNAATMNLCFLRMGLVGIGLALIVAPSVMAADGVPLADKPPVAHGADGASLPAYTDVPRIDSENAAGEAAMFWIFAVGAVLSVLGVVLSGNIIRMSVCLLGTLGSFSALYFLLAANFLGAIQLIVYAGGVLVLIIFGVMLTSKSPWVRFEPSRSELVVGSIVSVLLFGCLATLLLRVDWSATAQPQASGGSVAEFGTALLTTYLVPFEIASVLLLVVMIGAAYLARPEK
jgi:NADH:ubiquinone oxidoreductase subunit 6 (subunit J)